jgi:hypothetical protein
MLTQLKCAQRLGHFIFLRKIPRYIPKYIARFVGCRLTVKAMEQAAWTKEDIVDVLNVGVEELIHLRYELPRFDHLLRLAYQARKKANAAIYNSVYRAIPELTRSQLDQLLTVDPETNRSLWNQLRQDTGKVTIQEINKAIERLQWIRSLDFPFDPFSSIPYVKFRHFAMEAKSLNANRADEVAQPKKAVLLAAVVKSALARTIDDIMIMIVKKVGKIHRAGKIKLDEYLEANRDNTDRIVTSYMSIHEHAYDENGNLHPGPTAFQVAFTPMASTTNALVILCICVANCRTSKD